MHTLIQLLKTGPLYELILPMFQKYDEYCWKKRGRTGSTPNTIKQHLLKAYATVYACPTFIETGTYLGSTLLAMKNHFTKLYSIELNDALYNRAVQKFQKYPHITIIHGDSGVELKALLKKINTRALFWLDAHYSGGITSGKNQHAPILAELRTILSHRIKNHIILIDDAWTFTGGAYPTLPLLKKTVSTLRRKANITVRDGVIIIV